MTALQILPGTGRCPEGAEGPVVAGLRRWIGSAAPADPSTALRAVPLPVPGRI